MTKKEKKARKTKSTPEKKASKETERQRGSVLLSKSFWTDGPGFYLLVVCFVLGVFVWGGWNTAETIESTSPGKIPTGNQTVHERLETRFFIVDVTRYPVWANVTERENKSERIKIGVNNDRDKLHYGVIPPDTSAEKKLELGNPTRIEMLVVIRTYGNASRYLEIYPERVAMKGESNTTIVSRFRGEEPGYYEGELDVVTLVPKSVLAQLFYRVYNLFW